MSRIIHQTQPTDDSCVSTCLAMILGRPVDQIYNLFHHAYYVQRRTTVYDFLVHRVKDIIISGPEDTTWRKGWLHLLLVPSANHPFSFHQVLVDHTEDGILHLFDPAAGRLGRRYYVLSDDQVTEEAIRLRTWRFDYFVKPW